MGGGGGGGIEEKKAEKKPHRAHLFRYFRIKIGAIITGSNVDILDGKLDYNQWFYMERNCGLLIA